MAFRLDFSKLNDPAFLEDAREAREAESRRIEAHDKQLRGWLDLAYDHYEQMEAREREFVNSCRTRLYTYQGLSAAQEKWLGDIAKRFGAEVSPPAENQQREVHSSTRPFSFTAPAPGANAADEAAAGPEGRGLRALSYSGPWCCEKGQAAGVPVCADCAETSDAFQSSMGVKPLGTDPTEIGSEILVGVDASFATCEMAYDYHKAQCEEYFEILPMSLSEFEPVWRERRCNLQYRVDDARSRLAMAENEWNHTHGEDQGAYNSLKSAREAVVEAEAVLAKAGALSLEESDLISAALHFYLEEQLGDQRHRALLSKLETNSALLQLSSSIEQVLVQAIEASGYSVSGPTDARAAEHGEPTWVCNARGALAHARSASVHPSQGLSDLRDCLRYAVERVRIANAEGNPILSAWLPDAEALLQSASQTRNLAEGELTNVRKTVIQFTVLHDDDMDLSSMTLHEIDRQCAQGDYVGGGLAVVSSEALTDQQVGREASKIGSDGSFFDSDVELGTRPHSPSM